MYGLSRAQLHAMNLFHDKRCWICGGVQCDPEMALTIDHCHETYAVRGLLCSSCNNKIRSEEPAKWLREAKQLLRMAAYLELARDWRTVEPGYS